MPDIGKGMSRYLDMDGGVRSRRDTRTPDRPPTAISQEFVIRIRAIDLKAILPFEYDSAHIQVNRFARFCLHICKFNDDRAA